MKLKEILRKVKAKVVFEVTAAAIVFQTSIAYADPSGALTTAEGKVKDQAKDIVNNVVQPILEILFVGALLVAIGHAVYSYRKARELEFGWIIVIVIGLILVTTFDSWGWNLIS